MLSRNVGTFLFFWHFLNLKTELRLRLPVANTGYVLSAMWEASFTSLQQRGAIIVLGGVFIFNLSFQIADGKKNYYEPNVSMHFSNWFLSCCGSWRLNPQCLMEGCPHERSTFYEFQDQTLQPDYAISLQVSAC